MSSSSVVRLVTGVFVALVALLATLVPAAAVPSTHRPGPPDGAAGPPGDSVGIEVLSSRPEYVSGGDARIAVSFPRTVPPQQVELLLDGEPVDADLREVADGVLEGVVDGLPLGTSVLEARANGRGKGRPAPASVEVTNHPRMGPMFSGPHQTPFYCQTEAFGLGPALDDDCDAPTRVEFKYVTTAGAVADLPAGELPADLATTTTTTGDTVDFIIRVETGVINRAVYETAVLYDPDVPDTDAPGATRGWNDRIIYPYGGGCNAAYAQGGNTPGVVRPDLLGQGYAVVSSSLNVLNNECNDVVSAETTSMVKEEFIERYGADDHTIGLGGSGGAISQYLIAHNYPGLIDGLVTTLMYPDAASILPGVADCGAMFRYFSGSPGLWDEASRTAVSGYPSYSLNCVSWAFSFANRIDATAACNPIVPAETWYDPATNPDGVRCSVAANAVNVLGVDPVTGLAPSGFANEGVQYGLRSLLAGDISAEQFLAVNEGIGGFDEDGLPQVTRTSPDAAIDAYYSGGRVVTGTGLANVPIVTVRDWRDAQRDIHTHYYTFNLQERLLRDNGTADNMVIQVYDGQVPAGVRASAVPEAIATVDDWLAGLDDDVESRTIEEVVAARPADAREGCWTASGDFVEQPITFANQGTCGDIYPSSAESRWEAGGPVTGDILACALQPLDRDDYPGGTFTDDQWGRMEALFGTGVCDWTKPGIGQVGWAGPWQDYSG